MWNKLLLSELPEAIRRAYPPEVWRFEFAGAEVQSGGMVVRLDFHTTSHTWHLHIADDSGAGEWHRTDQP